MKYIVTTKDDGKEEIFLFPSSINHDAMAEMLPYIKTGDSRNWKREHRKPVSAGFINNSLNCVGRSETLDLDSRPERDTELLRATIQLMRAVG